MITEVMWIKGAMNLDGIQSRDIARLGWRGIWGHSPLTDEQVDEDGYAIERPYDGTAKKYNRILSPKKSEREYFREGNATTRRCSIDDDSANEALGVCICCLNLAELPDE